MPLACIFSSCSLGCCEVVGREGMCTARGQVEYVSQVISSPVQGSYLALLLYEVDLQQGFMDKEHGSRPCHICPESAVEYKPFSFPLYCLLYSLLLYSLSWPNLNATEQACCIHHSCGHVSKTFAREKSNLFGMHVIAKCHCPYSHSHMA